MAKRAEGMRKKNLLARMNLSSIVFIGSLSAALIIIIRMYLETGFIEPSGAIVGSGLIVLVPTAIVMMGESSYNEKKRKQEKLELLREININLKRRKIHGKKS